MYVVRFNTKDEIIKRDIAVNQSVYFAPEHGDITAFVFTESLMNQKGSDASWRHNNEPPDELLEYSDDEQERAAKKKPHKNKDRSFANEVIEIDGDNNQVDSKGNLPAMKHHFMQRRKASKISENQTYPNSRGYEEAIPFKYPRSPNIKVDLHNQYPNRSFTVPYSNSNPFKLMSLASPMHSPRARMANEFLHRPTLTHSLDNDTTHPSSNRFIPRFAGPPAVRNSHSLLHNQTVGLCTPFQAYSTSNGNRPISTGPASFSTQSFNTPSQHTFQQPRQQTFQHPQQQTFQQPQPQTFQHLQQQTFQQPQQQTFQQSPQQMFQQSPQKTFQQSPQKAFQQLPEQPFQQPPQHPFQQLPQQPLQQPPQQPFQQLPQQLLQHPPHQPLQQPPHQPLQLPPQQPLQLPPQQPLQRPPHQPFQEPPNENYQTSISQTPQQPFQQPPHENYQQSSIFQATQHYRNH